MRIMSEVEKEVTITLPEEQEIGEIVSDESTPSFERFRFKAFHDKFVSPGTVVAVAVKKNTLLVGRVTSSHENNPHFSPDKVAVRHAMNIKADHPGEELSITVFRLYEVEVLEQATSKNGKYVIRPPDILPTSGTRVVIPKSEVIGEVLGIKIRKEDGLFLGNLASTISAETNVPVVINKETIQRHFFVGGTTGSGKSYAAKVLAEEIHKHGIPIIFFDTQNEFVPLTKQKGGHVLRPGQNYFVKLSSLTEYEVLELIPSLHHQLHVEILNQAVISLIERGTEFGIDELLNEIHEVCHAQQAAPTTEKLVAQRTRTYLRSYNFLGTAFDWKKLLKKGAIIDIDCNGVSRKQLQLILAASMRELQQLRIVASIPPYMLMIDEAHLFVPQDEDSAAKQIIREGVRIGRHHGICLTLITQSPMDIDKRAIRQCNTRLIFAIEGDQLQSLQGVKADATQSMLDKLPKSPQGTCILSGTYETVKHAIPVQIRPMETQNADGGQAPAIFELVDEWK